METKKNPEANQDKKRFIYFQIGIIISLSITLFAFEWENKFNGVVEKPLITLTADSDFMINTRQDEPKPKPMPKVQILESFEIVVNTTITDSSSYYIPTVDDPYQFLDIPANVEPETNEPLDLYKLDIKPEFPGGEEALMKFLVENIKYPRNAFQENITGKVYVKFIINEKGFIENIEIERGVVADLDNESKRVVSLMPKWKPGFKDGKFVKAKFILPINFKILE